MLDTISLFQQNLMKKSISREDLDSRMGNSDNVRKRPKSRREW